MSPTTTAAPALIPDIEVFEEKVAIHIHEGGIPIDQAKDLAAQARGLRNQAHYWAWLRVYADRKRLGSAPRAGPSELNIDIPLPGPFCKGSEGSNSF